MSEDEVVLKLKSILDERGFSEFRKATDEVEARSSSLGSNIAMGLGVATVAAGALAAGVYGIGKAALSLTEGNAQFERYETQLGTLLGSADAAKDRLKELSDFGAKTPFELPELVEAEKVLVGFGLTTEKTTALAGMNLSDFRTVVGDVAAGTGKNFSEIALTFGKFSAGATGEAIARLQEMGVVTKEQLAAVGVEFSKSGSLLSPLPEAYAAAVKIAQDKFGGGMDKLSATFEGQMSTLSDTWGQIKRDLAQPLFDALKGELNAILPALGLFSPAFAEAKDSGLDPLSAAGVALAAVLDKLGLEGAADMAKDLTAAVAEATAVILGHKDSVTATDPEVRKWAEGIVAVVDAATTLAGWVASLTKLIIDHKGVVLAAIGMYTAFKAVLAIQSLIGGVAAAMQKASVAWSIYASGGWEAVAAMVGLDLAMLPIIAVIGLIVAAGALLYVAWTNDWGGIQEKTQAVVNWFTSIPAYFSGVWADLKSDLKSLFIDPWQKIWLDIKKDPIKGIGELIAFLLDVPARIAKVGADIVKGLLQGMKNAWSGLKSWWTGSINDIPKIVAHETGAMSPARKLMPPGHWIVEGLALGMRQREGHLVQTAKEIADAAMAALGDMGGGNEGEAIAAARRAIDTLARRIWEARDGFLTGGEGQEGSLAWLVKSWGKLAPDFAKTFAALNIPVSSVREFASYIEQLSVTDPERATVEWGKFWDSMKTQQQTVHDARMKQLNDDQQAINDIIDLEKKHFDYVKDQEAQAAAKPGGKPVGQKTQFFSEDKERVAAALQPILDMLGDKDLASFWKRWNDDMGADITTTEDLSNAIEAVMAATGRYYDDKRDAENDSNDAIMANLEAQAAFIQTLIDSQKTAEEDLADLIALRQHLLEQAADAIRDNQAAQEAFEDRVHDGIMANIAEEREARKAAHEAYINSLKLIRQDEDNYHKAVQAGLDAERAAGKEIHDGRIKQLDEVEKRINDNIKDQERAVGRMKQELAQFTIDIGYEAATAQLDALKAHVQELVDVAASFKIDPRGREALDAQRAAKVDRVVVTSDAQRAALQAAKDAGTLTERQARIVDLALGGGRMRAAEIQAILGKGIDAATAAAKEQQDIVDGMKAEIALREQAIALAEQKLAADKSDAEIVLAAMADLREKENERFGIETAIRDERDKAEAARHAAELGRIDGLIAAETTLFDAQMDYLDRVSKAEGQRHADRMTEIAEEAAFKLASLGMGPDEIAKMIEAAQKISGEIAEQVRQEMQRILSEMPLPGQGMGGGVGGPGGPNGISGPGLPLGAGGHPVLDLTGVEAKEATVKEVNFGGMQITQRATLILPSGRELALETVETILEDVALVDKLGKKIDEQKARTGQLGGSP